MPINLTSLERRLEKLEGATMFPNRIIRVVFVRPGHLGAEVYRAEYEDARFERLANETEDQFQERVEKNVTFVAGRQCEVVRYHQ